MTAIDLDQLAADINRTTPPPVDYSIPDDSQIVHTPQLPEYVQHKEQVPTVGRLTAEAVVRDYEAVAKHIENMGKDLSDLQKRWDEEVQKAHEAIRELNEVANRYRGEGKRLFELVEKSALLTKSIRETCVSMQERLAQAVA